MQAGAPNQPPDAPILNIVGELVALGPMRRELLSLYLKWINDFEVTRTLMVGMRPTSLEAETGWFERVATDRAADPSGTAADVSFTVYERITLRPIGTSDLHNIDHRLRRAEFGIMIGEKDCWGRGYGTETARLTLDYGFTALGLHNIMLTTQSYNERGIRAYLRAGFKELGRRREAHRLAGKPYDVIYMDCLASEFESPVLQHLLP